MEYKFTISGRPIPKKNNPVVRVIPRQGAKKCPYCGNWTKVRYIVSFKNKRYAKYELSAIAQLRDQKNKQRIRIIEKEVHCMAKYWLEDLKGSKDLVNLKEATADLLQGATIIENDNQIKNWDGSRIMGVDKENPRQEITLRMNEA